MDKALDLWMTLLRDKKTQRPMFRDAAYQVSRIIAYQVAQKLPMKQVSIETPISSATGTHCVNPILIVPILRSGMAMLPAFLEFFPNAQVGVVGLKRDETTAIAHWYYHNVPSCDKTTQIIIIDPMIATGGTGVETLKYLRERGANENNIFFASIVSAPDGLRAIQQYMPSITIICAVHDPELTSDKYIRPGLGDFGDRYFGTES